VMITDERKLERMCVPRLFWKASMDQIPDKCGHKKIVAQFIEDLEEHVDAGYGLLLYGENSQGKSALATLIMRHLRMGRWGLFVVGESIPGYVIDKKRFDGDQSFVERMQAVDLLVIDELILHDNDTFRDTILESVLRERLLDKKSTIVTTNLLPDTIATEYTSLGQVMLEAVLPVAVAGHNFRRDKAAELMRTILK